RGVLGPGKTGDESRSAGRSEIRVSEPQIYTEQIGEKHGYTLARHPVRRADALEKPRRLGDRDSRARSRHRREQRDLQRRQHGAAAATALRPIRPPGFSQREEPSARRNVDLLSKLPRLARAQSVV